MDREGMAGELKDLDWSKVDLAKVTGDQMERWEKLFIDFFSMHTKDEIGQFAKENGATISPVYTIKEVVKHSQLEERGFWSEINYPQLNADLTHPGGFCKLSNASCGLRRPAPAIGEHNLEIYEKELGISRDELIILFEAGVI